MTRIRARHAIAVGVTLAVATAAYSIAATWRSESGAPVILLAVGGPLCFPWLALWGLEQAPCDRVLGVFERVLYGLLALCELGVFFYLPRALESSEGFILLFVWGGGSAVATIVLAFVNQLWRPAP